MRFSDIQSASDSDKLDRQIYIFKQLIFVCTSLALFRFFIDWSAYF